MNFRVGQKVVCVDDDAQNLFGVKYVIKGRTYVISWAGITDQKHTSRPELSVPLKVRLAGIDRNTPFSSARFRPLIERSTDSGMAILKKIADEASKGRVKEVIE